MSSFTGHAEMYRCTYGETPKLTSTNYSTWSSDIAAFLRAEDVLEIVRGNEPPPPAGNNQVAIKKTEKYRARVGKAFAIIVSSCSQQIKTHIKGMEDPTEIWAILKEKLDSASSRAGQLALVRTFHMLRPLDSDTSINQYIARLMDIRTQLAGTNEEMSDARLVSIFLQHYLPHMNRLSTESPLHPWNSRRWTMSSTRFPKQKRTETTCLVQVVRAPPLPQDPH